MNYPFEPIIELISRSWHTLLTALNEQHRLCVFIILTYRKFCEIYTRILISYNNYQVITLVGKYATKLMKITIIISRRVRINNKFSLFANVTKEMRNMSDEFNREWQLIVNDRRWCLSNYHRESIIFALRSIN